MSIDTRPAGLSPARADATRRTALVAGVLYLITFAASIPALALLDPVLGDPGYVTGAGGGDTRVLAGNVLDIVNAAACVGTAVVLFPLLRRQGEALALGFVTSRVLEAAVIGVGVISVLSLVTLRQESAGADAALTTTGELLVATHDAAFLLGPGLMAGCNALLLGTLMYRSRLVPRAIPALGLVGGPLQLASVLATIFGVYDQVSPISFVVVAPLALWELSLGLWMTFKGFAPSPASAGAHG